MRTMIRRVRNILLSLISKVSPDPYLVAELWRKQGVKIGTGTCVYRDVVLSDTNGLIQIGNNCVLTGCAVIAHDASTNKMLGLKYGEPSPSQIVTIEDDCFIGYHAIILMGVKIGKGSIVGAGSVVTRDVPSDSVVSGNPAKVICTVAELVEKRIQLIKSHPEIFPAGIEKLTAL